MAASVSELSGLGLLTWVYPPGLVDRVVAACGRVERRKRLLPARLVVYFVLGLALFSPAPYLEVMRHLVEGLRGAGLLGNWHVPAKSSLFRARDRLGSEPLRVLFATTAKPMATEATPGAFWRGLRLLAMDGTCWDVADSEANEAAFGRPGNGRGTHRSAFVQVSFPEMRSVLTEGQMVLMRGTSTMAAPRKYSLELRERAVRMYRTSDPKPQIKKLAVDLGVHPEALRGWIRQAEADAGERDDRLTTDERAELVALRKENVQLKRANDVLRTASAFFAAQLDPTRPR
ncbi:transposase domain-containing protein [Streptomyces sp. NPDC001027]|uniref:transposase domain-containing protein n=1 Tax=Streptomyces sp. NPDC001027 TaxID=3154771 RepID=UPI003333B694